MGEEGGWATRSEMTLLESKAIGTAASAQYKKELDDFMAFAVPRGINVKEAKDVDQLIAEYLNKMFAEGRPNYRGNRFLAAFLRRFPEYGKNGSLKLLWSWRALKGFLKLTPGKSRRAMPLASVCSGDEAWRFSWSWPCLRMRGRQSYYEPGCSLW